ncbi:MAG: hypothetical protein NVS3B5_17590 [Sphingomicrobium sp.]
MGRTRHEVSRIREGRDYRAGRAVAPASQGGPEALADHRSRPDRVWNRIPDDVRGQIIDLALQVPELSPRELAVRFTDEKRYFVSEASVYRLLKAHDLITSRLPPARTVWR